MVHFPHLFSLTLVVTAITHSAAKETLPQNGDQPAGARNLPIPENMGGSQQNLQTADDSEIINLADHPACRGDVQRLCHSLGSQHGKDPQTEAKNSLDVLECFINHDDQAVSKECHQVMWEFKSNVTRDPRIAGIAGAQCAEEINKGGLKKCEQQKADTGHYISCLVEEKTTITDPSCLTFVNKVALVVFSDYRLVQNFAQACEADVKRLNCGHNDQKHQAGHSQGATLNCLVKHLEQEHMLKMQATQAKDVQAERTLKDKGEITPECSHQVLRLLELQADDFHLDRALFFACRNDRENFCHDVQAGNGKVYQCLMSHKEHEQFSKECREQLVQREVAAQTDYKVDYGLGHMCQTEIQQHQCLPPQGSDQGMQISYVILCLEGVIHKSGQHVLGPQCMQAVFHQRQAMMSDYNISPNIVVFCKPDIEQNCKDVHPKGIIHCLMGVAKEKVPVGTGEAATMESKISGPCSRELNNLLMGADVAGDVKVDTVLYEACRNIIDGRCSQVKSNSHLMGCLMQHMQLPEMTDACEMRLLESHYFVTRDIRLDAELFEACKDEAVKVCGLRDDWTPQKQEQGKPEDKMAPEQGPLTFSCLYRHAFGSGVDKPGLSQRCVDQVKTTLHERALAMEIPPEVDVSCIHDLAYFCADKQYKKGQEFQCLQAHYTKLQKPCQAAVQHYTQAQTADVKLSATYKNCAPMLDKYCRGQLTKESTFDDAMDCLIPYKDEPEMSPECMAEIHHYQLINIQEYQLNIRFKESCKEDIINYCSTETRDIGEVIVCLSSIFRDDTLSGDKQRISKACRSQLRHELSARAQQASLDPMIKSACETDIQKLCPPTVIDQGGVLECLRQKVNQLTSQCHKRLFKVEQLQAVDEYADYTLVQACRRVIEKKCREVDGDQLLPCLIEAQKNGEVDPKCGKVIATRQLEEYKDVRLNPALYKVCNQDMQKHCKKELKKLLDQENEAKSDVEDDLMSCLKKHKKNLSSQCGNQIREMMKESAQNYKLDPKIADVCAQEIQKFTADQREEKPEVMEYLKGLMKEHKLKDRCAMEVARRVSEGKADIYVDPILYSACQVDLNKLCYGIEPGEGRQFQCLTYALSDGRQMTTACQVKLKERQQFVKYASEIYVPENLEELASSIVDSPARYYFLSVTGGFLLAVLVIGICCGRATKRVRRELKNR